MILLVDFRVHFSLLLSKRAHLKEPSAKKGTSTENFGRADRPSASPPFSAPEGLRLLLKFIIVNILYSSQLVLNSDYMKSKTYYTVTVLVSGLTKILTDFQPTFTCSKSIIETSE